MNSGRARLAAQWRSTLPGIPIGSQRTVREPLCDSIDPSKSHAHHPRNSESQGVVPHADKKRVTIERHCCRESHLDAEEMTISHRIAAGETGREPAPKEQPPRKLSGR